MDTKRTWSRQLIREYAPVAVLLAGGLTTSLVLFMVLRAQELEVVKYDFTEEARTYFRAFERQLQSAIDTLKWSSVSLAALPQDSPWQLGPVFQSFGEETHSGIVLQWAPRVDASERAEFERHTRESGRENFVIRQFNPDGSLGPAENRDAYFPILYSSNEDEMGDIGGFDCGADSETERYLQRACDSGKMFFSPRIPYVEPRPDGTDVLAIYPVYRKNSKPDTEATRRENLLGFLLGHLKVGELSEVALSKLRQQEIDLYLFDAFEGYGEKLLHFRPGASRPPNLPPLEEKDAMNFGGISQNGPIQLGQTRRWILVCIPTQAYLHASRSWIPLAGLLASLGLTLLVAYHIVDNIRLRRQAEAMVKHRTAELNRTNQRLRGEVAERVRFEEERDGLLGLLESSNASLQDLNTRLERSNRDLQEFALVASHDLKEPLRKVQVLAGTLRQKCQAQLAGAGEEYLELIEGATLRMQGLITNLLQISRVSTHGQQFVAVNLQEILDDVVSDLEVRLHETGGEIAIGDLPLLKADPVQMHQCMQNILDNCLKFHKDGERPRISIAGELLTVDEGNGAVQAPRKASCRIIIRDNGIGFPPQDGDRVFALFHRADNKYSYEGNGVGLAVCRKIVERHGGHIVAESEFMKGSVFTITLPLEPDGAGTEPEQGADSPPQVEVNHHEE